MPRPITTVESLGEDVDNDDDNDIKEGMSDILIVCNLLLLLPLFLLLLLTVK